MTSGDSELRLVDILDHIEEASRLAREYVAGMSKESFLKDRRTIESALCHTTEIALPLAGTWRRICCASSRLNVRVQ